MFFDDNIVYKLKNDYKDITITNYSYYLKNIFLNGLNKKTFKYELLKTQQNKIIDYINNYIDEKQRHTYMNAVKVLAQVYPRKTTKKIINKYIDEFNKIKKKQYYLKPKQLKEDEQITFKELITIRNNLDTQYYKNKSFSNTIKRLIIYLYTEIDTPFRSQDWINSKYKNDKDYNYIDLNKRIIYIRSGKSINSIRAVKFSETLKKIMIESKEIFKSDFVLPLQHNKKKHISSSELRYYFHTITGKKISPSKLRHLAVSNAYDSSLSMIERAEMAKNMGHHISTAQTVYTSKSKLINNKIDINNLLEEIEKLKELNETLKKQLNNCD